MLESIWNAISSIPNTLKELIEFIGNILSYLNPFSEDFFLKDFFTSLFDVLNPFSENFFLKQLFLWIGTILNYLNPFSEDFFLKDFFEWFGNFFSALWEFVYHIFIPTDEQWDEITNDYNQMGETLKNHVPFISLFSEELKKAQATVEKTDPLIIRIPSFSYSGSGGIGVDTGVREINLTSLYEPYRAYIRGFLLLVVVALAFVYLIKYVLNYGVTSAGQNIDTGDRGGGNN